MRGGVGRDNNYAEQGTNPSQSGFASYMIRYDTIVGYLTCSKKLTGSQLSLPHRTNKKLECETKKVKVCIITAL